MQYFTQDPGVFCYFLKIFQILLKIVVGPWGLPVAFPISLAVIPVALVGGMPKVVASAEADAEQDSELMQHCGADAGLRRN